MRKIIHKLYVFTGTILCGICLLFWSIRDKICPPKTNAVLFVAHPDDDTLFFHTFIKERKPYVCLMTSGCLLRRMPCFFKVMKKYGVRYRAYPMGTRDKRTELLERHVRKVLSIGKFEIVATHNSAGEYGHEEHIRVHDAVLKQCKVQNNNYTIICPVEKEQIAKFPLTPEIVKEKQYIFSNLYTTESWVLDDEDAGTPVWVTHEQLERVNIQTK